MTKLKELLLFLAEYDEPFYILVANAFEELNISDSEEVVAPLLELVDEGYVSVTIYRSDIDKSGYIPVNDLTRNDLMQHIESLNGDFENFPTVDEYFFKTTEKGEQYLLEHDFIEAKSL